jgi:Holliday junction resolvasome RuvABC endonuclease subunit
MIREHNIKQVYFERVYAHKGVEAAHLYGYFMHTLAAVCEEYGIKCVGLSVSTIKKFATEKGNATKEEMIAAAKLRGFNPIDDNEADALAILLLALKIKDLPKVCRSDGSFPALREGGAGSPGSSLASETFARLTGHN